MIHLNFEPLFIGPGGTGVEVTAGAAGSKAAMLWRMHQLGLEVPPAFVMPTALCAPANGGAKSALEAIDRGLRKGIAYLEEVTGRRFGDSRRPLLVSVRSGAERSMPGMLETVLDVGLNDETVRGLIRFSGNPRLAWDSYRRFIQSYSEVVGQIVLPELDERLLEMMRAEDAATEAELDCEALERLTKDFQEMAARGSGHAIPHDPVAQLAAATRAVYLSWESAKARDYRRLNALEGLKGTAVTVQAMVFGNAGGQSGAGVAFSRNPSTGAKELYVDFLFDAQGEDVVSGRRTPGDAELLKTRLPAIATELAAATSKLEEGLEDIQDIEFTVEEGKLYFLQTRPAKRSPLAAIRIAVDLVREGLIDPKTALARIAGIDLSRIGKLRFNGDAQVIATAISASPGVASGRVVFQSERAKEFAKRGDPIILVRPDVSTDDIAGFAVAAGILTATGGRTAHAAVVARQMGKICLVGCKTLCVDADLRHASLGDKKIVEGDWISLEGTTGEIFLGQRDIIAERPEAELAEIEGWSSGRLEEEKPSRPAPVS
ncbi:pyruvate, phosphate dikinase [Beijerinckiaceae bacterium]|nr:pyruvate, phosphate dikinase [Beijerinckiaceae bacterium]